MARIFTIDFQFGGSDHAAVVSTLKGETQADWFQIMLFDDALYHLVPDGILRFSTADDGSVQGDGRRAELVHCLKRVVAGYLQKSSL
jgi:hypothetical protein